MKPASIFRSRMVPSIAGFPASLDPVIAKLLASRAANAAMLDLELGRLLHFKDLRGIDEAAESIAESIIARRTCLCAGDYDVDGAVSSAIFVLGLRALGAGRVDYVVPDRFKMGYGLSPLLVEVASERGAQLLVTVDNGIASHAGVDHARASGMTCVVTDHHLPGGTLPAATAIVNANQPGCCFQSKALAGCGTIFYTLLAVRARLKNSGWFDSRPMPNLCELLDLVAFGTVADVVPLDYNNRILVEQGLRRIRSGRTRPGIAALMEAAGVDPVRIRSQDFGWRLGPLINAAGRLQDIRVGIECLLAQDLDTARPLARQLVEINQARRERETDMRQDAETLVQDPLAPGLVIYSESFHEGVVGLVAGRLKEQHYRPTMVFAPSEQGVLKGSGRSIAGIHLRDVLARLDSLHPGLQIRFGGHAAACGTQIKPENLEAFRTAFVDACRDLAPPGVFDAVVETDGELDPACLNKDWVGQMEIAGPWGQGFPEPLFEGSFQVVEARRVGSDGSHARYRVSVGRQTLTAIHFGGAEQLVQPGHELSVLYRPGINLWKGASSVDLRIEQRC